MWGWRRLFHFAEDINNPLLITGLWPAFLSKTVFSDYRSIGLTELPVSPDNIFALRCKR
jgi:hypothetical protein